jgi:hypothetical protein
MLRSILLLAGFSALIVGCASHSDPGQGKDGPGTEDRTLDDAQAPSTFGEGYSDGQGYKGKPNSDAPPQSSY